ncbi:related to UV radiation resistance associated protein p63 [Phialocephala subalpina]|uniref:Autophagy-related protein 14 n=1 Tax=Phialocephala subalpina TaxID=576137 RepID=A0A1L7WRE1_9HELO|nr:related to UV radiation resistance associated protein p63 [Phialocephala subalpina]
MSTEPSRPLLLPQNRKLRHLQGIYIRNLTLSRPRGRTIDDAALNKSPQKVEALRNGDHQLHHAHSSSELRPPKLRRRSTNWVGATPDWRQRKLEDVIESRMADAFFSLHVEGQDDEPVYISEVVEKAMNPTFRFFDLSTAGPGVTRQDTVVIKVWVKRKEDFVMLLEEEINLQSLQFIDKLEGHSFPPNCVLFHLVDGIYTIDVSSKPPKPKDGPTLPTSSYSALMRLSNLDESIQDALATREELAAQINAILHEQPVDESPQAQKDVALATRYVASERKQLKASIRRRAELKASIEARSKAIKSGNEVQAKVLEDINNAQEKLAQCRILVTNSTSEIHQQRRRICEELLAIFPIEPTSHPLLFTICGLPLPNSTFEDADEDVVSAALGYVARLVDMLQYYLTVPLSYPISPYGSRSIIQDLISILQDNQRTFPLYMKSTVRFRFDYGVFLLNKNIECLAESQGLKVMDIRQTLPNLKYLLYVCSAGSSELPARKAGGIRGLLTGRGMEITSRRGSADSGVGGGQGEAIRKALENGSLESRGIGDSLLAVPFGGSHVKSLRTSGLRENVR